jgi:hypothetical protein
VGTENVAQGDNSERSTERALSDALGGEAGRNVFRNQDMAVNAVELGDKRASGCAATATLRIRATETGFLRTRDVGVIKPTAIQASW